MKNDKRWLALSMAAVLTLTGVVAAPAPTAEAAKAKLNKTKLTVQVGKTKTLKLKNNKKKVKWSVVSGKTRVKLKSKKKTSVKIVGKKKGTAKVQAKIGKKKLTCKVTVKAASKKSTATSAPKTTKTPNQTPKPVVTQTELDTLKKGIEVDGTVTLQNSGVLLKIINNNKKAVQRARIEYTLYKPGSPDSSNKLAMVSAEVYGLQAGETRYEYCQLYVDEYASIGQHRVESIEIDQSQDYNAVKSYLEVKKTPAEGSVNEKTDKITVTLKNKQKKPIDRVSLLAVFYDKNNNVLDVCKGSVSGGIGASDTQTVDLFRTSVDVDKDNKPIYAPCVKYSLHYVAINF